MRKKIISSLVIVAAILVFVYCMMQMMPKLQDYKKSDDTYRRIRKEVVEKPEDPDSVSDSSDSYVTIDWEAMKGTDCVAWLILDDISYPVMHTDNDTLYMHHLPDKTYNYGGSIFLFSDNDPYFTDESSFLYGHNMANGSMFGTLRRYKDPKYTDHQFYLYLPDGTCHTYTFFSVLSVPKTDSAYSYAFASAKSFVDYQNEMKQKSLYTTGPDADKNNRLVSLSTCNGYAGTSQRLIVQGVETSVAHTQQAASWYVPESENKYTPIQKNIIQKLRGFGLTKIQAENIEDILIENSVTDIDYLNFDMKPTDRGYEIIADGANRSRYVLYIDAQDNHMYAVKKIPESDQAKENGAGTDGIWIWQESITRG